MRTIAAALQKTPLAIHLKGWQAFCERYLFRHWELLLLERALSLPLPCPRSARRWPAVPIDNALLPAFDAFFGAQVRMIRGLLDKGYRGQAHLNERGQAIVMVWANERDYFDEQQYRAWVPVPPGCIYQHHLECAAPYRSTALILQAQKNLWQDYARRGFKSTRALVDREDSQNLKLHVRIDFEEVGETLHVYRLFNCLYFNRRKPYHEPRLLHLRKHGLSLAARLAGQSIANKE